MTEERKFCRICKNLGIDCEAGTFYCSLSHRPDKLPNTLKCDEFILCDFITRLEQENKANLKQIELDVEHICNLNKRINELEQENEKLKKEVKQIGSDFIKKGDYARELEQENKELKAYKDVNEDFKKAWDELNKKYTEVLKLAKTNADSNEYCLQELEKENKQIKSTLEEIREIVSDEIDKTDSDDELMKIYGTIYNKINEVLTL